ncbi:MAG TPA: GvpL/GvpF family gas vesicle protein [Pyrinomonadaceae bacterium]|nr:GvpL/GvpF family gas vesicle protein [Pyrinomonadaceae bacterium]
MTKRASKKGGVAADARASEGFYVYCIGTGVELAPLFEGHQLPGAVEESARLELIAAGDLTAVVSAVPLASYGEEALPEQLADAAWTATRAMRHEFAVEFFARRAAVIPLRFGTIYLTRRRVERLLEERGAEFKAIIARLAGCDEWGVNVYVERARLRERVVSTSPRLREMAEQAAASSPGQAYLLRKKIDALRADEARVETRRVAAEIERELSLAAAAPGVALRLVKDEANEHGELAARFAFLVRREDFDSFREAAERLAERHAALGFRLELTGPWPAYHFVALNDEARQKK